MSKFLSEIVSPNFLYMKLVSYCTCSSNSFLISGQWTPYRFLIQIMSTMSAYSPPTTELGLSALTTINKLIQLSLKEMLQQILFHSSQLIWQLSEASSSQSKFLDCFFASQATLPFFFAKIDVFNVSFCLLSGSMCWWMSLLLRYVICLQGDDLFFFSFSIECASYSTMLPLLTVHHISRAFSCCLWEIVVNKRI